LIFIKYLLDPRTAIQQLRHRAITEKERRKFLYGPYHAIEKPPGLVDIADLLQKSFIGAWQTAKTRSSGALGEVCLSRIEKSLFEASFSLCLIQTHSVIERTGRMPPDLSRFFGVIVVSPNETIEQIMSQFTNYVHRPLNML
jgi:hypothetical protein